MDTAVIGQAVTVGVFVAFHVANRLAGKKKDEKSEQNLDVRFAELRGDVADVRSFCVGPDGKNGFRKEIADMREDFCERIDEIKTDVKGMLDRERERLGRLP